VLRSNPGREDVETRGKDVVALAEVGEVGTLIGKSGGTDGDSVGSGSRRVVAGVGVVVTSSDGAALTARSRVTDLPPPKLMLAEEPLKPFFFPLLAASTASE
jgi:hypothetical protein